MNGSKMHQNRRRTFEARAIEFEKMCLAGRGPNAFVGPGLMRYVLVRHLMTEKREKEREAKGGGNYELG